MFSDSAVFRFLGWLDRAAWNVKDFFRSLRDVISELRSSDGFTAIEGLVVVIIIGILLAIAIPTYLALR